MRGGCQMSDLQAQTIEMYSKQLRTPMFNNYTEVIRQLDQNQNYGDFLVALMKLELDSRLESTRRKKMKSAAFPYIKTIDELDCSRFEHMQEAFIHELASCDFITKRQIRDDWKSWNR
jgi:DNA replication protein DnaC